MAASRLLQIGTTLGSWAVKRWLDNKRGRSELMFKQRAGELRAALIRLGPAFVKIAQAVSSRPDVIPPEYLDELALLQDRIAPFSTNDALDIVEQELGVPVDQLFSDISPLPVAAASLGQVYQARLRPNGQAVAVKVQRPGVRAAIALDIFILRILAGYVRKFAKLNTDLQAVVDEWASSLFKEMDYESEARNGARFRRLFGGIENVVIPEMYPDLTSQRVLVMQWVEGERLSEVRDLSLIEVGVYCSLSQLLDSGFYHADPHPGNLLRTPEGKLAYLDFGMMGEVTQSFRDSLIEASVHLVNREFDSLARDFVALGLVPPGQELSAISDALTGVFAEAISQGARNISFGDLSGNLGRTMYRFKFRIPAYFSLVVRSLTVLEGIALRSNPQYKVLGSSYPWIARKVLTDQSPQLRSTLKALLYKDGTFRVDRLESLLKEAQRPIFEIDEKDKTVAERDTLKKVLTFALSNEGTFVRETLLDEIVKGIDAFNRAAIDAGTDALAASLPFDIPLPQRLTEAEDYEHLKNLRKIAALLQGDSGKSPAVVASPAVASMSQVSTSPITTSGTAYTTTLVVNSSSQVIVDTRGEQENEEILTWDDLPLIAQQQAVLLPAEVIGLLTSRALARTIRSSIPRGSPSSFSNLPE
eukprot:SM000258S09114  [mRNA]  locus=s258:166872:173607:- [translate_table: standard]